MGGAPKDMETLDYTKDKDIGESPLPQQAVYLPDPKVREISGFNMQTNQYLYMVCVFMGYASLGAHFVLFPNVMVQIFGLKGGVQLCSFIYVTRCPSALSGLFISKALVTNFGEASYSIMCYTSCVFIVISTLVLETIFKDKPIRKDFEPEKEICLPSINFE